MPRTDGRIVRRVRAAAGADARPSRDRALPRRYHPSAERPAEGTVTRCLAVVIVSVLAVLSCAVEPAPAGPPDLASIRLPDGFSISYFAKGVKNARSLSVGPDGIVFVGTRRAGLVHAVVDADGDGRSERTVTIAKGLNMPNGVAYREGSLYVAEVGRILRYDGIAGRLDDPPEPVVVTDAFPDDRSHGWKFIRFSPGGRLFVPVGAPCNVCDEGDPYASIMSMNPDGGDLAIYARGVRNSVGFDWDPATGVLWFTDNGRDSLGDDVPPDELNRAPRDGMHFGYPWCHGGDLVDPDIGEGRSCADYEPPARRLGPHVAAIGMRFYDGAMFPERYRGQIFIAEHGSWDRSEKIGYRVTLVTHDGERGLTYEPFAEGWLKGQSAWGRPADVAVLPDGSLLVSDDSADAIYRIAYDDGIEAGAAGEASAEGEENGESEAGRD